MDRAARDQMARALRLLAARRITNRQFEARTEPLLSSAAGDPAISEAYELAWGFYCDFRTHRIARLTPVQRREFARVLLFLRTSEPYCWIEPDDLTRRARPFGLTTSATDLLLSLWIGAWAPITSALRVLLWLLARTTPELCAPRRPDPAARESAWPFADEPSLHIARATRRLLAA